MCRPTVSVAIVSSTLASSTLTPPTMACQVAKNRKAAGEMVVRLLAKTEKVLKDIKRLRMPCTLWQCTTMKR